MGPRSQVRNHRMELKMVPLILGDLGAEFSIRAQ